jgi:hypothetical protein
MVTKICSKCGIEKPTSCFYLKPDRVSLKPSCKECHKKNFRRTLVEITCAKCGETAFKRPGSKYCSVKCSRRSRPADAGGEAMQQVGFAAKGLGPRVKLCDVKLGSWEEEQLQALKESGRL